MHISQTRMADIQFKNLSFEIQTGYRKVKKKILKNLNGVFKAAELTAIMGPSGAGKSTLLNVLTGFQQGHLTGAIEYISSKGKQNWAMYKKQSCYIQQTDNLYGLFTVQESMMIVTSLKIGSATIMFRQILIDNVLDTLKLSKVKNTRVDQLSGGQKKRLSIALELIDNPPIMFLDEPTTGLDSLASLQCISALQTLAKSGRTVICTIHQPSAAIYQMFDYIYLVVDGHCLYAGTPDNTMSYFAQQGFQCPQYHNPADYMLEIVNQEYGNYNDQLITAAKKYCQREETPLKMHIMREAIFYDEKKMKMMMDPPSEMIKFRILLYRSALIIYRDWSVYYIKIIMNFFVAVLFGLIFEHVGINAKRTINNVSFLMITILYFIYTSLMPAVLKFPLELNILKKERFNNWYQLKTYYIAMLVFTLPLTISSTFVFSIISYILTKQPMEWSRFFMFLLITSLTSVTSESVGLGLGTIFNPINGTFFGAIITAMMMTLAGFLVFFNHMPRILYYVSYINYYRFAFDGLIQAIYGFQREAIPCPSNIDYCHLRMPSLILEELSMTKSIFWIDVIVLLAWFMVIRTVAYVTLKRKLSKV